MASIVPSLSPAGSTMVRPCQLWTVSMLGADMHVPFLVIASLWLVGGRDASARCPVEASRRLDGLAVPAQPGGPLGRELLGGGLGVDRRAVTLIGGGLL